MLLAIDVGNTTVDVGVFKGRTLIYTKKILTKKPVSKTYYLKELKQLSFLRKQESKNKRMDTRFRGYDTYIMGIIISSVVPDTTKVLKVVFKKYFGIKPVVLGEDLIVPIKNLYKNPKQVGQDRLVNAYAGYKKFGGGLIIVDFGTAVTFDVVSRKGEYLGGIIVPGIETSLKTLSEKAALLPKIKLDSRFRGNDIALIGKDTKTSMLSGILHGFGALCDGLICKIKKKVGADFKVILTGGHSKLISKYCHPDIIQPTLVLEGLRLIFENRC